MPATPEKRERVFQEILSENPELTRAQLEEWADDTGRRAQPGELARLMEEYIQSRSRPSPKGKTTESS